MPGFLRNAVAVTFAVYAAPAFADLSAEDVWADLQAYSTSFGYEISAETERNGNSLIISNVNMTAPQFEGEVTGAMKIEQITLREEADGSVIVDLPAVMPIEMTSTFEDGESATIRMDYLHTNLNIVVTGTPEDILYTYQADAISLRSNTIQIDGLSGDEPQPVVDFTVKDLSGTTDMTIDSQRRYDQAVQAGEATYSIAVSDPETQENVDIKGKVSALAFEGSTSLPLRQVSASDMNAMLAAGFTVDGTFTYQTSGLEIAAASAEENFSGVYAGEQGRIGVVMDASQLEYDVSQENSVVQMTSEQFPLPIAFDVALSNFKVTLPVQKSDEPQDFALGFTLDGFSMSDAIWGIFDPTSQLPRDPAVIALDLAGQAKVLFDFLNPDVEALQAQTAEGPPAELESVEINKLQVSVAGADLTGQGSFDFQTTPLGMPQPVGAIDLTLVGGNALIDKLVSIGLVPEQQAMGARMMLGLLAVPGDAPDTLNSKIEINEQGHIAANGQRIQ